MEILEGLFRWIHVVAGILWIGLLYFFNWVNSSFAPTMDAETRRKVVPELMPRALFWFRWGAAFTWVTGVLLLLMVFYHTNLVFEGMQANWGLPTFIMLAIVFFGVFAYDLIYKSVLTDPKAQFVGGLVLASVIVFLLDFFAGFSFRGYAIHLGALFGTIMAYNVWFRIWPAQQKIITAIKNGEAPDASLAALAGGRSKHNTYVSVPLVFTMLNQHMTFAANPIWLVLVVLAGWGLVYHLYDRATKVKGF
jgi:uncharacterized membrane protein